MNEPSDRGQVSTALVVTVSVLLLAFALTFGVRLSQASDEAGNLQQSADAAALAGAQAILRDAPEELVNAIKAGRQIPCGLGQESAGDFAKRNDATIVSYCYYPANDEVRIRVRSNQVLESGKREEREAVAELGLKLGPCDTPRRPTPSSSSSSSSPSSSSGSSTSSTSKPPPDVDETLRCGDVDVPVTWPGEDGDIKVPDLDLDLSAYEPALVD